MSSSEYWLVDGWNVLHGLSAKASRRTPFSPEELLSLLADFAAHTGCRMLVIWDGHGPGGDPKVKVPVSSSVESLYSAGKTADDVLERYLFDHRATKQFAVVTDDGAMTRIARGSGARVFSIVRFHEMVQDMHKNRREKTDRAQADAHGFNRPFDQALRKKGWTDR